MSEPAIFYLRLDTNFEFFSVELQRASRDYFWSGDKSLIEVDGVPLTLTYDWREKFDPFGLFCFYLTSDANPLYRSEALDLELDQPNPQTLIVKFICYLSNHEQIIALLSYLLNKVKEFHPEAISQIHGVQAQWTEIAPDSFFDIQLSKRLKPKRNITDETREIALKAHEIKTKHPSYTYAQVAIEVSDTLGIDLNGEHIRNAYRAMGWKWERGDRAR